MWVKKWFWVVLLGLLLVTTAMLLYACARACPTGGQFCVAIFGSLPTTVGANVCPQEVHICPGETATLYWNVSEDVTKVTIISEFGTKYGPFTVRSGSQNVTPAVTTRYTMKAEGEFTLEQTVTVNVVRGGEVIDLVARGDIEAGVWTVDVSPVTTSPHIIVSTIKTVACATGSFWNKWDCKKTDLDSHVTLLSVTEIDSPANDIPLVGSWEFTPRGGVFRDTTACFQVTIKCQETSPTPGPNQPQEAAQQL